MLRPNRAGHDRCLLLFANVHNARLMCPSRCAHTMFDASMPWMMSSVTGTNHFSYTNMLCPIRVCHVRCHFFIGRCMQATTRVAWLMCRSHNWCFKSLVDVIWHWTICVGHEWCHLANAHMPQLKLAGLGWCLYSLEDIVCHLHPCYIECLQKITNDA